MALNILNVHASDRSTHSPTIARSTTASTPHCDIAGAWLSEDKALRVRIRPTGHTWSGKLEWTGTFERSTEPPTDADREIHAHDDPVVFKKFVYDMKRDRYEGILVEPPLEGEKVRELQATLTCQSRDVLALTVKRRFLVRGLFRKTLTWHREKNPVEPPV